MINAKTVIAVRENHHAEKEMIVYFCLRSDHSPRAEVLKSLTAQTVPCEVVEVRTDGGKENTHRTYSPERQVSEALCRRLIFEKAIERGDSFFCVSDWDVKHLISSNLADCLAAFDADSTVGAISIMPNSCKQNIGFAMYRLECVKEVNLDEIVNRHGSCMCREVTEAVEKTGYKFIYLDNLKRIREY